MNSRALRILSVGLGILLLLHGIDKIVNGTEFIEKLLVATKVPYSEYVQYLVYIGEVIAPLLLIFGQYMRIAGAIVFVNMLTAIFLKHQEIIFTLGEHGEWSIELPVLYLVIALAIALWEVDSKPKAK